MNWLQRVKLALSRVPALWLKYRTWILYIVILVLILLIVFFKPRPIEPIVTNNPLIQTVKVLRDRNNKISAELVKEVVSRENADRYADSLAKALKLKPKFIKGVDRWFYDKDTVFVPDTSYTPEKPSDTAYYITKKDGYLDLQVSRISGREQIKLGLTDTVTRTEIYKNRWLGLAKPKRSTIIRNASPYVEMRQGTSWEVYEKTPWLVIGPSVGYDPINQKVIYGVTATLPLIKLNR